jgi:ParB-like chromosome segregation protein Spo0J
MTKKHHSEEIEITKIKPYAKNPRKISDEAVNAVVRSIAEFGFRSPIIVDENYEIIAGHTRLKAAHRLNMQFVPVHIASGLNKKQIKALRLADNKVAEFSDWDDDLLNTELLDINDVDLMEALGFDIDIDVADMAEEGGDVEPQEKTVTMLGDVWILGGHRLICGKPEKESDMIVKRWQKETKKDAIHETSGSTFNELDSWTA